MKILSYKLESFIPFQFSKIKRLTLNYPSDMQIILGNNGCGKSSYLRTLTPYPLTRSLFDKGIREMVLEHQGHVYTLISDYNNKTSPHQFIRDDEGNLNEGGTTNVQNELVESYLGLTREKENLLFGDISFCDMKPGEVKPFLMKTCPLDLGWMLDKQKKISSALRNMKAELKYLVSRETQLLSEMMSEDDLNSLKSLKEDKQKVVAELVGVKAVTINNIKVIDKNLDTLLASAKELSPLSKEEIEKLIAKTNEELEASKAGENLSLIKDISPEDYNKYEYELASFRKSIEDIVNRLNTINSSLEKTDSENVEAITAQLVSDKNRLNELKDKIVESPFSDTDILDVKAHEDDLKTILDGISKANDNKRIWSRRFLETKEHIFRNISYKVKYKVNILLESEKYINSLEEELKLGWTPNINPCAEGKCPLYVLATSKRNERLDLLEKAKEDRLKAFKFVKRYEDYILARDNDLKSRRIVGISLDALQSLVTQGCPCITRFIKRPDFLNILSKNPYSIYQSVMSFLDRSEATHEYRSLEAKIASTESHLETLDKVSDTYKQYLLKDKASATEALESARSRYEELDAICEAINVKRLILASEEENSKREAILKELARLDNAITYNNMEIVGHENKLKETETAIASLMTDLANIEVTLSSQDKITSRYEEEVKLRKNNLSSKIAHFTELEYATTELPKKYMWDWLEALVEQVNRFISVVWNQPLEVKLPTDDKDYKFTALFKGKRIDSLQLCSTAQKDIINLCVCLALRSPVASTDGIGMKGYPLALDETGRTFDEAHKSNLIDLFNLLIEEDLVSQIYLTSHHAVIHGAMTNIQTLVLNPDNIAVPAIYNQEIDISYN